MSCRLLDYCIKYIYSIGEKVSVDYFLHPHTKEES